MVDTLKVDTLNHAGGHKKTNLNNYGKSNLFSRN